MSARDLTGPAGAEYRRIRRLDTVGLVLTVVTVVAAVIWAFPLYWAVITTFKPEQEVVRPYIEQGRLIRVLEDWCEPYSGYHLYYPSRRQSSPAFTLLREALRYPG